MRCALAGLLLLGACYAKPDPFSATVDAPPMIDGPLTSGANHMFTTSNRFAMSTTTVADADAHCMKAAAAGGLPANTYVAWLSTTAELATERLAGASGWVRTDGRPFARTAIDIAQGRIFYPPRLDEHGTDLLGLPGPTSFVATSTDSDGSIAVDRCDDFPGNSVGMIRVGAFDAVAPFWTAIASLPCSDMTHLYCFGIERTFDLPTVPPEGKLAYVTTLGHTISSLAEADSTCTTGGGGGQWVAFLAPTGATARSRVTSLGPYYRPDGVMVAADLGAFIAPISQTRAGAYVQVNVLFGAPNAITAGEPGENCGNWTFNGMTQLGDSSRTNGSMFTGTSDDCDAMEHLYCIEN